MSGDPSSRYQSTTNPSRFIIERRLLTRQLNESSNHTEQGSQRAILSRVNINIMLSYAEERAANIARNKELLASLGVEKLKPTAEPKETRHRIQRKPKPANGAAGNKRKADVDSDSEKPYAKTARLANDENAVPRPEESTEGRRRSSRIAGKPADALERVERTRGTPQPMSVKALVRDASEPKRVRRYNP